MLSSCFESSNEFGKYTVSRAEFWHLILRHVLGRLKGRLVEHLFKYSTVLLLLQTHGVKNIAQCRDNSAATQHNTPALL